MQPPELTRRGLLGTAGGVLASGLAGADTAPDAEDGGRQDFLYLDPPVFTHDGVYRNLLAYARRHDLAVILAAKESTRDVAELIEAPLRTAREAGVEAWLITGCLLDQFTAEEIAESDVMRELYLMEFRKVIEQYRRFFPEGKILCWHEEPQTSNWAVEGETEAVVPEGGARNFVEYGPTLFDTQKRAINEIAPDVDVGIFPHSSTVIEGGSPRVTSDDLRQLIAGMRELGTIPDFVYCDYYRGYVEPRDGVEAANADVRGLVEGVKELIGGRPVYFLGEDHTIGTGYTPSKAAIRETLRAARSANPAGLGWYIYTSYAATTHGFDSFLPNEKPAPYRSHSNTFTRSRDRFQYAYRSLFETCPGFDPAGRFDVWLAGLDFPLHDHRLSLLCADTGEWEHVGDFGGYIRNAGPGEDPYAGYKRDHVSIFHGLRRDRYVQSDGTVSLRVTNRRDSSAGVKSLLRDVYLLPYDTADYVTEPRALALRDERDVAPFALGAASTFAPLSGGDSHRIDVGVSAPDRRLGEVLVPDAYDRREALAAPESAPAFDPASLFDLWVGGAGLDRPLDAFALVADGERVPLAARSLAGATADGAAAFYGLDRALLGDDLRVEVAAEGADPEGVHAMPYHGRDTFKPPAEIHRLLDDPDLDSFRLAAGTATAVPPSAAATPTAGGRTTTAPGADGFGLLAAAAASAGAALARLFDD